MTLDRFGRHIHYLRISVTDRCNFQCVYCMPDEMVFRKPGELMKDEEILTLVRVFTNLGFDKFRLTGGEPTVRPNLVPLVSSIAGIEGVRNLTMTTNGVLLKEMAIPLARAGLQRVNISLDTLDPQKFCELTRRGSLDSVWEGIQAAEEAGLTPIKINVVVMDEHNFDEVERLAHLTLTHPWQVRFIEMLPFGGTTALQLQQIITAEQIKERIEARLGSLLPVLGGKLDGEARLFRLPNSMGDLGFIASVSQPFCDSCTRARLTADGRLRLCLLKEMEIDLLTPLRAGADRDSLRQMILDSIWMKPWGHSLATGEYALNRTMSQIGG